MAINIDDLARINVGDTVTAEFNEDGSPFTVTAVTEQRKSAAHLGPFALFYTDDHGIYPSASLLRIAAHHPKPAPLYTNRTDIKAPRNFDVVMAKAYPGGTLIPHTYFSGMWRGHGASFRSTEELLQVGPLTLVATAQQ